MSLIVQKFGGSSVADAERVMNVAIVYSFTNPPKHIFLVHGEEEGQEILKQKIEETSECKVSIPNFGDSFELGAEGPTLLAETEEIENFRKEFKRLDLIERIEELKENISDIESIVMQQNIDTNDNELRSLEERVKEIQKHIQSLMK